MMQQLQWSLVVSSYRTRPAYPQFPLFIGESCAKFQAPNPLTVQPFILFFLLSSEHAATRNIENNWIPYSILWIREQLFG